jgi:hypothetical protein
MNWNFWSKPEPKVIDYTPAQPNEVPLHDPPPRGYSQHSFVVPKLYDSMSERLRAEMHQTQDLSGWGRRR